MYTANEMPYKGNYLLTISFWSEIYCYRLSNITLMLFTVFSRMAHVVSKKIVFVKDGHFCESLISVFIRKRYAITEKADNSSLK